MHKKETIIFLHGLGQTPQDWNDVLKKIPQEIQPLVPDVQGIGFLENGNYSLQKAAVELADLLDKQGIVSAHFCGLSLGAILAAECAHHHPERVKTLFLSGMQIKPNVPIMAFQSAVFHLMPKSAFKKMGTTKEKAVTIMRALQKLDMTSQISGIDIPVMLLNGGKDRANKKAAIQMTQLLAGSKLVFLENAGHEVNKDKPAEFAKWLSEFILGSSV